MVHIVRDTASNFSGSVEHGDSDLTRDVILNQVADLIVHNRKEVLTLLNDKNVNLPTSEKASDKVLIDKIIDNLDKNEMLLKGLSFLIANQMDLTESQASGDPVTAVADSVSSIAKVIGNKQQQKNQKEQSKSDIAKMILAKKIEDSKSKSKVMLYVVIGTITAVVIIGGFFAYKYFSKPVVMPAPVPIAA